jgi:hypothetical protein
MRPSPTQVTLPSDLSSDDGRGIQGTVGVRFDDRVATRRRTDATLRWRRDAVCRVVRQLRLMIVKAR